MKEKRYYRAVGVAEFIVEGHTIAETEEEFGITKCTIQETCNIYHILAMEKN